MKLSRQITVSEPAIAIELLAQLCPEISKSRLKDAMSKGAVWVRQGKQQKRLRRAQAPLAVGMQLTLCYDDDLLQRTAPAPVLLADTRNYSVWYKPPGLLSQGNEWGDHLSLLRQAEQHFNGQRKVFLVHRLDREASGLVLIAHQAQTAGALGKLIQAQQIAKTYQVLVAGQLAAALLAQGEINLPLDGKASLTRFRLLRQEATQALLEISLVSGRKHQIRRHFAAAGHPVMGDPQYGRDNKDPAGLGLQAVQLAFTLPGQRPVCYQLPAELCRFQTEV